MHIIVIGQQKGGVGKSTLAGNIAATLAGSGQRVILVDADKQQSCVKWASRRQLAGIEPKVTFASLLAKEANASDFVATLRKLGEGNAFDTCIIDVGGRDNRELRAALALADVLVAPCLPSQTDIEALSEFDELVGEVLAFNPNLKALTVINKATTGLNFSQEIALAADAMADLSHLRRPIAIITDRPTYRNAWLDGKAAFDLDGTPAASKAKAEIAQIVEAP